MEPNPDEEDIDDVVLNDEIEHHWRMFFEDNNEGVDGTNALIYAKKCYVYN